MPRGGSRIKESDAPIRRLYNDGMAIEYVQHTPSRNISQIVYDPETQTLRIEFLKGGVVEFYEVDETAAHGFETALSATKFMNAFIENQFPSQRII